MTEKRDLTESLLSFGHEQVDIRPDKNEVETMSRFEALAFMLWRLALGFTEQIGTKRIEHKPDKWAIKLLVDKLWSESPGDDNSGRTLADKLKEFDPQQVNEILKGE